MTNGEASKGMEDTLSLYRWVLGGVCTVGAFLMMIAASQISDFGDSLEKFDQSLIRLVSKMETISLNVVEAKAEQRAIGRRIERIDDVGTKALREHEDDHQ